MRKQLLDNDPSMGLTLINASIRDKGFSEQTLLLIDNYITDILNGKTNLTQFNQSEHAGLCCAGEVLIGAYIVCNYARAGLEASQYATTGQANPANWEIDELHYRKRQFNNGPKLKAFGSPMPSRI